MLSQSQEEHLQHVDDVLNALKGAGVTLKLAKCSLFTGRIKNLGHVIRPGTSEIEKVSGIWNLSQSYVASSDSVTSSACSSMASETSLSLFTSCLKAHRFPKPFRHSGTGKSARTAPSSRRSLHPLFSPSYGWASRTPSTPMPVSTRLDAHCSKRTKNGERKPIGFWSRTLTPAERNCSTAEKECLAVIYAVQTCRPYLEGEQFTIHTDHAALRWLTEISDPSGELMRWRLRVLEFTYNVEYLKGVHYCQDDAVSRLHSAGHADVDIDEKLPCFTTAWHL